MPAINQVGPVNDSDTGGRVTASDPSRRSHRRFVITLGVFYFAWWSALAINPVNRNDWALENIVVAGGLLILFLTWRHYIFSRFSYFLITLFLAFHAIGSHYTYSEVPYQEWVGVIAEKFSLEPATIGRNHFDRFVHFAYGLLLSYPFRESFLHFARIRWSFWSYLVPLAFALSTSLLYELLEWAAAVILGGDIGIAFLGSQGDIWDAQKDSFCALVGSLLALTTTGIVFFLTKRGHQMKWVRFQEHD
jgi:putative membrane protein